MNEGLLKEWKGQWSPCLIPYGCLLNLDIRKRLIGGVLRHGYFVVRRPPPQNIKKDLENWLLDTHNSSVTDQEFTKYLKIFKTHDQKLIDEFLDEE
jgi:hypothetical protein